MIDSDTYARYMSAIADRTRAPLMDSTNALYYVTLSNVLTTEQFEAAARIVFATYDDFGFPPPAVFLKAIASEPEPVDAAPILRQIEKLSVYNANVGMVAPWVGDVRERLGCDVADAYAAAGGARCFSDDETTRSIAQREFQKSLTAIKAAASSPLRLIEGAGSAPRIRNAKRITAPESLADVVKRAMTEIPPPSPAA